MDALLEMRTLLAVSVAGSLSKAAREMEVSVAMVSKRMNALEARLGVRLLIRTPRRTGLTLDGERYAHDCRRILDDLQEADAAVSSMPPSRPASSGSAPHLVSAGVYWRRCWPSSAISIPG